MKIKSLKDKLEELDLALDALKNANNNYFQKKEKSYLLDMMGRLRALVGLGGIHMNPLLINLSKELDIPLELFASPPPKITKSQKLVSSYTSGKTWTTQNKVGTKKYILEDWLNTPIYYAETSKQFKTRNQVLKDISNTMGGSHYDDHVPHIVDTFERVSIGSGSQYINGIEMVLIDISPLVFWLGKILILKWKIKELDNISIITETYKIRKKLELENEIKKITNDFDKLQVSGVNLTIQAFV